MAKINPLEVIEEIYKEHYVYLKNILIGLTKNVEIADDIIQEVFAKILMNPSMILEVTYMKSWLVKAAKNTLLDYYKKKKPELLKNENSIETLLINNQSPEVETLINSQLEAVLGKLSTLDRTILLAKVYYGYDYQEISDLLDIPVPTLKSKIFRLRKQMAKER
ncbi:RNA polymerase sigma factor [Brevibacillus daliensis]|uniref:RNA polymerase sigma factor n=1 Tax=Brevibacillus daliensis TaxID=2892995 RepID=UPI001E5F66B1|nr:RNA polymerase sigma factor [Brevibacillus daliensis]